MEKTQLVKNIVDELDKMQATDIISIDVTDKTIITDTIIIATGKNKRHVSTTAKHLIENLKKEHCPPLGSSGITEGEWALVDFGHVVVHIMLGQTRAFYNLEGLWQVGEENTNKAHEN